MLSLPMKTRRKYHANVFTSDLVCNLTLCIGVRVGLKVIQICHIWRFTCLALHLVDVRVVLEPCWRRSSCVKCVQGWSFLSTTHHDQTNAPPCLGWTLQRHGRKIRRFPDVIVAHFNDLDPPPPSFSTSYVWWAAGDGQVDGWPYVLVCQSCSNGFRNL